MGRARERGDNSAPSPPRPASDHDACPDQALTSTWASRQSWSQRELRLRDRLALQKSLKHLQQEHSQMNQEHLRVREDLSILLHKDHDVEAHARVLLRLYAPDAPCIQRELRDVF